MLACNTQMPEQVKACGSWGTYASAAIIEAGGRTHGEHGIGAHVGVRVVAEARQHVHGAHAGVAGVQ